MKIQDYKQFVEQSVLPKAMQTLAQCQTEVDLKLWRESLIGELYATPEPTPPLKRPSPMPLNLTQKSFRNPTSPKSNLGLSTQTNFYDCDDTPKEEENSFAHQIF